jgi:uncharacterized membrane protein
MKFNKHRLALAAATTTGIFYTIKSALIVLFPRIMFNIHAQAMHLVNVENYMQDVQVTLVGFVVGFIHVVIHTYLIFWVFAYLYNRFEER